MKITINVIKLQVANYLQISVLNLTPATAGIHNGKIKKMVVKIDDNNWNGAQGRVAVFYKNCKTFTNHENVQTQRPCEFFTFELEYTNDEDEGDSSREFDFWVNEMDFFDSVGHEWKEKKSERQSDSEFINFWM